MTEFQNTMIFSKNLKPNQNPNFGILKIAAKSIDKPLIEHLKMYLNIDISGSMSEHCRDGKEKIHHIRTIIKNLLRELYNFKEQKIAIIVNGFESTVHKIMDIDNLSQHSLAVNVLPKIDKLVPLNSTNIEKALKKATKILDLTPKPSTDADADTEKKLKVDQIVHIMLTDGNATEGITNPDILKTFMPSSCKNILLGIGNDYDAKALKIISSSSPTTTFKHINEAETAGLCVGEIVHSLLFEVVSNLKITIKNGKIYDYMKGEWTQTIHVDSIASEQTKVYHIKKDAVTNLEDAKVEAHLEWTANNTQHQCVIDTNTEDDLTQYQFRQEVLELLHRASKITHNTTSENHVFFDEMFDNTQDSFIPYEEKHREYYKKKQKERDDRRQQIKDIKKQLKDLLIQILKYMDDNNLQEDMFYITLCKDLKVSIDSIGNQNADLYISTRLTSQGSQETYSYNPNQNDLVNEYNDELELEEVDDYNEAYEELINKFNNRNNNNNNNNNNLLNSPYATQRQAKLMRDISSTHQTLSDDSE